MFPSHSAPLFLRLLRAWLQAWFLLHPPSPATVEVQSVDDFEWLNSSYCPVLRQLESAAMKVRRHHLRGVFSKLE